MISRADIDVRREHRYWPGVRRFRSSRFDVLLLRNNGRRCDWIHDPTESRAAAMAVTSGPTPYVDEFNDGLNLVDDWTLLSMGDFVADDGEVVPSAHGITVSPPARHPETGKPAFTKAIGGPLGHLKWVAMTQQAFPTSGGELRFQFRAGCECFGMADHPYGDEVADPDTDLRLGAATLNVIDMTTGMVFDFWITNGAIYPLYERLNVPGLDHDFEAFVQVTSPISRAPGDTHDLCIAIDVAAGSVRWEINGKVVATINSIGPSDKAWTTLIDHGGKPEDVAPSEFRGALGLMTLVDSALPPSQTGLADLGVEFVSPKTFHGGPLIFGQGAELRIERFAVTQG
jgi:Family of unknown function (DUF6081)